MHRYIALIRKEAKSDFGVEFPDFPGCITAGSTLDEAFAMAEEALEFHVQGLKEDGTPIPEPSGLDAVLRNPDLAGAVAVFVPLREKKGRAVPVRITLDEYLLADIDQAAVRDGTTRSAFLAEAARAKLAVSGDANGSESAHDLFTLVSELPVSPNARFRRVRETKDGVSELALVDLTKMPNSRMLLIRRENEFFLLVAYEEEGKQFQHMMPVKIDEALLARLGKNDGPIPSGTESPKRRARTR